MLYNDFSRKWLAVIAVVAFIVGFASGKMFTQWQYANDQQQLVAVTPIAMLDESEDQTAQLEETTEVIMVHIAGAVQNPGVYQLEKGQRVEDALALAKIAADAAVDDQLNRAALLVDGQKLVVPSINDQVVSGPSIDQGVSNSGSQGQGLVNINLADKQALMTLPGIGEVKAQAIIDYRSGSGLFQSTDELKQVKGIGEKTYEGLKAQITV